MTTAAGPVPMIAASVAREPIPTIPHRAVILRLRVAHPAMSVTATAAALAAATTLVAVSAVAIPVVVAQVAVAISVVADNRETFYND